MGETKSLASRGSPLADPAVQLRTLREGTPSLAGLPGFEDTLGRHALSPLLPTGLEILQVNLGKLCNQTCKHCHVDAGPDRREVMSLETMELCLRVLRANPALTTVDIT